MNLLHNVLFSSERGTQKREPPSHSLQCYLSNDTLTLATLQVTPLLLLLLLLLPAWLAVTCGS
jgi:hypothetical protein